jgi:hypothetical protein
MATQAQINANRSNARKSTGPRTEEGKQRSSQNALKHGLLARDAVLPGEDPADFDRQLSDLEDTIEPKNALESALVRQIADADWRLRRLTRLETGFLADAMDNTRRHTEQFRPERLQAGYDSETLLLGSALRNRTQGLLHLARYGAHLSRNLHQAVKLIRDLRADEHKYGENHKAETGGIHRPTVTDPDPYNTPDPDDERRPPHYVPDQVPPPIPPAASKLRRSDTDNSLGREPQDRDRKEWQALKGRHNTPPADDSATQQENETNPIPSNPLGINYLETDLGCDIRCASSHRAARQQAVQRGGQRH